MPERVRGRAGGLGATVTGQTMLGPVRGPWADSEWTGSWGRKPSFGHPVFGLTNHPCLSGAKDDGTTSHFVTDGVAAARERAPEAVTHFRLERD